MKKVRQLALIDMTALCDLLELEVKRHKTSKRKIPGTAAAGHEGTIRTSAWRWDICMPQTAAVNMNTVRSVYVLCCVVWSLMVCQLSNKKQGAIQTGACLLHSFYQFQFPWSLAN